MKKIIVVDDEPDVTQFAKRFFERRKIQVLTASGGVEALRIIEKEKPDLALLDITMEEMSGLEVLKKLREKGNDMKVIMVTGLENEQTINEANSWGVRGYIHKPLILEELEKIVLSELEAK